MTQHPHGGADLFAAVRAIPSSEAAARLGLPLTRRGARHWACCPMHGERTPSLCFYPDGRYHCFGCHASGTTVDLYMALCGLDALAAAKQAAADFHIPVDSAPAALPRPRRLTRDTLRRARRDRLVRMRGMREAADRKLSGYRSEDAWDDPEFLLALTMRAQADELSGMMDASGDEPLNDTLGEYDDVGGYDEQNERTVHEPVYRG